jgi:hypothetical protein
LGHIGISRWNLHIGGYDVRRGALH